FATSCATFAAQHINPALQITDSTAMGEAVGAKNPFVAGLLQSLQESGAWIGQPISGLIHDSHYDSDSGSLANSPALAYEGKITQVLSDTLLVEIVVHGDFG